MRHHNFAAVSLAVVMCASAAALQIVIEIVNTATSDMLAPPFTIETLNAAIAARNLTVNATVVNQRVIYLSATLLASCASGYYHDFTTNLTGNASSPPCVQCNCTRERWIARAGGGVRFAPLDPLSFSFATP